MVDEILHYEKGITLTGKKTINEDSIYFQGHFPGQPIFPGVMLIEVMFQAGGLLVRLDRKGLSVDADKGEGRAIKVEDITFKKEVRPNDVLTVKVDFIKTTLNFSSFKGIIKNQNGEIVAKGTVVILVN